MGTSCKPLKDLTTEDPQKPGEYDGIQKHVGDLVPGRIWIDGCFDFFHHGHAGAIVQARQLGAELYAGVHSDKAIFENKGPTVMTLDERMTAVDACRWVTRSIAKAPYVTDLEWIDYYGCQDVVHGDDITSDSSGEDCYRFVKAAGRFKVVKRTPMISTTDLVGRMLIISREHFIKSFQAVLAGQEGSGTGEEREALAKAMKERIILYATDSSAVKPGVEIWFWSSSFESKRLLTREEKGVFTPLVKGPQPKPGQRVVYVDGGFDLFSMGHIQFLRKVIEAEEALAKENGWCGERRVAERIEREGEDYPPAFVVAGIHDDEVINDVKGLNFPIMNIYERGLCLLQCRYVNAAIFGAPFSPNKAYLGELPFGTPDAVYHGPTDFMGLEYDPYEAPKAMGIFHEVPKHGYEEINAEAIVNRIMLNRQQYLERQQAKAKKAQNEEEKKKLETELELAKNRTTA
ncbi:putative ethanolamine-phosphate cytidylyltransferase [Zalerion maritima]|uniref:ethanolamine-phosphate cytidylyltransferase n=1 Tax=Zalerion maritima TaxID=339359 RepID=A0AAD5RL39_9PEZI|nr:putative ethanolamine-phosphate cytidylyltransferase [Zalerion maritima]